MEGNAQDDVVTYEDVVTNILRYTNITDFKQIDRMTIYQYSLLMEATRLKQLDEVERLHLLAFKIQVAKNTKKVGDKIIPAFSSFEDFFDRKFIETGVSSKALDIDEDELDIYKMLSKI